MRSLVMRNVIRLILGTALIAGPATLSLRAEDPPADKKGDTKADSPQVPGVTAKWDLSSVQEKFTVIKAGLTDDGAIYFLLELKEDMKTTPRYLVQFIDSDGVKFAVTYASCQPNSGQKGDKVRLFFTGYAPKNEKATWSKTVLVKVVEQ
jgi:hypothetical protein